MTLPSTLPAVRLQPLDAATLQALIDQGLEAARAAAGGLPLPDDFLADTWLWTLRLGQMLGEPEQAPWLARGGGGGCGAGCWGAAGRGPAAWSATRAFTARPTTAPWSRSATASSRRTAATATRR